MKTTYDSASEGIENYSIIIFALFTRLVGPCFMGGLFWLGMILDRQSGCKRGIVLDAWMTFCLCLYAGILAIILYPNFIDVG